MSSGLNECSTPFGIYEVGTRARPTGLASHMSAQRLSASMRLARSSLSTNARWLAMCSTPFGIYEVGTISTLDRCSFSILCSTPFGIYEVGTTAVSFGIPSKNMCSTPFGIYEVGTLQTLVQLELVTYVLNAFRHL